MGFVPALAAVLLAGASGASAEVDVRLINGRVSLSANATPLAEILDRLARQTGMRVVYEGLPPRQPLTVSFEGRTPPEAILGILEGLGLNYALVMDPTGTRVDRLLMAGAAPASRGGAPVAAAPARPVVPAAEMPPEEAEEEEGTSPEESSEAAAHLGVPGETPPPQEETKPAPQPPTLAPGITPGIPVYPNPISPFMPTPPAGQFVPLPNQPAPPEASPSPPPQP